METCEVALTSKGRVTVPSRLRTALGLKSGDKLVFTRNDSGEVTLAAQTGSLASLKGLVRESAVPVTGEQIARWIAERRDGLMDVKRIARDARADASRRSMTADPIGDHLLDEDARIKTG